MTKKNQPHKFGKGTATLVTVLIGLFMTLCIGIGGTLNSVDELTNRLESSTIYGRMEYENEIQQKSLYYESCISVMDSITGYATYYLDEYGYTAQTLEDLYQNMGDHFSLFVLDGDKNDAKKRFEGHITDAFHSHHSMDEFLTEEELYNILTEGFLQKDSQLAFSNEMRDGHKLVLICTVEDVLSEASVLREYASNNTETIIRIDRKSQKVEDSNITELIGRDVNTLFTDYSEEKIIRKNLTGFTLANSDKAILYSTGEFEGQILCSYISGVEFSECFLRNMLIPLVMGWVFLLFILVYVWRFMKSQTDTEEKREYRKIFGKWYVDRKLSSHIIGLSLLAVLLIAGAMIYVTSLILCSNQNISATRQLNAASDYYNLSENNREIMHDDFLSMHNMELTILANHFLKHPGDVRGEKLIVLENYLPEVKAISVFDATGTVEHDSGIYGSATNRYDVEVGYTLSKDVNDAESVCQDVISGNKSFTHYNNSRADEFSFVGKRQDAKGLVRIVIESDILTRYNELTNLNHVMSEAYFGTSNKAYIDTNDMETLHWFGAKEEKSTDLENKLPSDVLQNGFSGTTRIEGIEYYVNTKMLDDDRYIIMSARKASQLSGMESVQIIIIMIILFALQAIWFILTGSFRIKEGVPVENRHTVFEFQETALEKEMDERFRKTAGRMFVTACILIVIMLVVETLYSDDSMIRYLFGNSWPKGINLFSITKILMLVAAAIIGGSILKYLVLFFTENMGPRGLTIGRMSVSIIRFIILAVVIIATVVDIGVNTSTLLAGVGIIGAVISFSAQQTVNDFLAGFFIVFEGLFNIGDWITVDDFRGQVIEIGIRTTRIAIGGNVQVINNSNLKKVTIMAKNGTGAICSIDIGYQEDVNKVIDLIHSNKERYEKEIPFLLEGPFIDGVSSLGASGVTLRLWGLAEQEMVYALEREIYRVTKDLFQEEGIEIPYTQITIHNADE